MRQSAPTNLSQGLWGLPRYPRHYNNYMKTLRLSCRQLYTIHINGSYVVNVYEPVEPADIFTAVTARTPAVKAAATAETTEIAVSADEIGRAHV